MGEFTMSRKYRYDYYNVTVPNDISDDFKVIAQQAITEAEERSRIYAIPSEWTAHQTGYTGANMHFRVRRRRLAK